MEAGKLIAAWSLFRLYDEMFPLFRGFDKVVLGYRYAFPNTIFTVHNSGFSAVPFMREATIRWSTQCTVVSDNGVVDDYVLRTTVDANKQKAIRSANSLADKSGVELFLDLVEIRYDRRGRKFAFAPTKDFMGASLSHARLMAQTSHDFMQERLERSIPEWRGRIKVNRNYDAPTCRACGEV